MENKTTKEIEARLVKYFLDIVIMLELKKSSIGGYDVMDLTRSKFSLNLSSGSIYSVLYRMERDDLIKGDFHEGKRTYTLTEKGSTTLANIADSMGELKKFFQELLQNTAIDQ